MSVGSRVPRLNAPGNTGVAAHAMILDTGKIIITFLIERRGNNIDKLNENEKEVIS
jgi:hypothetical protein